MTPYPYGTPPPYWGKGRTAAGEVVRSAIELSRRVGAALRSATGKGDVLDLRNEVKRLFTDAADQTEAHRLLDLVEWSRRNRRAEVVSDAPLWEDDSWQE